MMKPEIRRINIAVHRKIVFLKNTDLSVFTLSFPDEMITKLLTTAVMKMSPPILELRDR